MAPKIKNCEWLLKSRIMNGSQNLELWMTPKIGNWLGSREWIYKVSRKNGRLILQTWSSDSNFWDPLQQISGWPDHQKGKYLYLWKTIYWCVFCSIKNITIVLNFGVNKIPCDYAELRLSIWLVRWSDMNTYIPFLLKIVTPPFLGMIRFCFTSSSMMAATPVLT